MSLRPFAHSGSEKIIAARNLDVFQNKLILATNTNLILEVTDYFSVGIGDHSTRCPLVNVIQDFHSGESRATWDPASAVPKAQPIGLMAVSAYPKQGSGPTLMCTAGEDRSVRVWNADQRNLHTLANGKHAVANTGMPCSCCDVSPDARLIVVGHTGGQFTVWDASTMLCVLENCYRKRTVSVVRFSRDSKLLVVCTHEKSLDCYAVRDNYRHVGQDHQRHSASITSADFSTDGKLVRTCDNAGELLYWNLPSLKSYAGNAADLRDVNWATQVCHSYPRHTFQSTSCSELSCMHLADLSSGMGQEKHVGSWLFFVRHQCRSCFTHARLSSIRRGRRLPSSLSVPGRWL